MNVTAGAVLVAGAMVSATIHHAVKHLGGLNVSYSGDAKVFHREDRFMREVADMKRQLRALEKGQLAASKE
jgi:hypothetical protein